MEQFFLIPKILMFEKDFKNNDLKYYIINIKPISSIWYRQTQKLEIAQDSNSFQVKKQ